MSTLEAKTNISDTTALTSIVVNTATVGGNGQASFYLVGTAGKTFQDQSNPGVNNIEISMVDPAGGLAATNVKMASTQAGLSTATSGAALDLGTSFAISADGLTGHPEVWIEITDVLGAGTHGGLSLHINDLIANDT